MNEPRIVSVSPVYPNRDYSGPPYVRVAVSTGLKSGKLTLISLTPVDGVRWAAELATNAHRTLTVPVR